MAENPDRALVLVVEDEPSQAEVLRYNLAAAGYEVAVAHDGDEALMVAREVDPDLILLDWMLPGTSGIEVCRQLKAERQTTPVIMLSARSEEGDRIRGLDTGADDYVAKPYSVRELLARVNVQLRRTRPSIAGQVLGHAGIELDPETHRVTRDGRQVVLGPVEFRLLAYLLETRGRVASRDQLLDRVWGKSSDIETRTVDVHVGRLRKALVSKGETDPIRTIRGVGYALG